jgi:hypothetical protein
MSMMRRASPDVRHNRPNRWQLARARVQGEYSFSFSTWNVTPTHYQNSGAIRCSHQKAAIVPMP